MHHAFKATAGAKVECLFFSHTNKFPVLFECILNQKVVSNSCYSNNSFLNYSKKTHKKTSHPTSPNKRQEKNKTPWKNLISKERPTSPHGVISSKFNNDFFGSLTLTVWLQDKRILRRRTVLRVRSNKNTTKERLKQ